MMIVVKASEQQRQAFLLKPLPKNYKIIWQEDELLIGDIYFDLTFEEQGFAYEKITNKPLFINDVLKKCIPFTNNIVRLNGWNSFLENEILELVITDKNKQMATNALQQLGWQYNIAPDEPGMIAPRIISMIINEAYYAFGEGVSTKKEIDIAMKLGTNYPFGPFEWSEKIGLQKIYSLLKILAQQDDRYTIAPALKQALLVVK